MTETQGVGMIDAPAPPLPTAYPIVPMAAPIRETRLSFQETPPQPNLLPMLRELEVASLVVDGHNRVITVAWKLGRRQVKSSRGWGSILQTSRHNTSWW